MQDMRVELHLLVHRVGTAQVSTRASQRKSQMRWEWGCEVPPLSEERLTADSYWRRQVMVLQGFRPREATHTLVVGPTTMHII